MKSELFVLSLATVFSLGLSAQTTKAAQDKMPSGMAKFDPAVCKKTETAIRPQADACLKIKEATMRSKCFDKIGQEIQKVAPNGACDQVLNPIKKEYEAKEKSLYPTQPSSLNGPQGGQPNQPGMNMPQGGQPNQPGMKPGQPMPQGGQPNQPGMNPGQPMPQGGQPNQQGMKPGQPGQMNPGQPGQMNPGQPGQQMPQGGQPNQQGMKPGQPNQPMIPAAVCEKLAQTIKPQAEACIKNNKDLAKRTQCIEKMVQEMQKVAPNGGCDKTLNPLKQEMMAKEKQAYPNQASAIK
jgi:hypothetical protein